MRRMVPREQDSEAGEYTINSHKNSKPRSHFTPVSVYAIEPPLLTPTVREGSEGSPAHIPLLCPSWQPEVPPVEVTRHWLEQLPLQVVGAA